MFFGKKADPVEEFMRLLIQEAAECIYKPVPPKHATELAHAFVQQEYGPAEAYLEEFVLFPLAYEMVRKWKGCGAGTCNSFSWHMERFGWASLVPIKVLLRRPPELAQVHFRMWEQMLRKEGVGAKGIESEFSDAEKYLQHMLLHATNDTVYRLSGQNRPFAGSPPRLPAEIRTLLQDILARARQQPSKDYFVTKEVDSLEHCFAKLIN